MSSKQYKTPSMLQSLLPIAVLILFLTLNVKFFHDDTLSGANQMALILASAVAGVISVSLGYKWLSIRAKVVKGIGTAMPAILILFLIGSLAGTWMVSGVVPMLIYYGLEILHPKIFLFAAVVICALVSVSTGSSWSTVATIGVALLGIGKALGFNEAVIAGAIISGAYFGDKMSPLSDTTNLAPAVAGTDLFTHVRYMVHTTVPSLILTMVIFLIIGFTIDLQGVTTSADAVQAAIKAKFNVTPVLLLVPAMLIYIIAKKVPPLPSLLAGTLLAALLAVIYQPHILKEVAATGGSFTKQAYIAIMKTMFGTVSVTTDNQAVNELLITRGMAGMLNTVWLIICAMVFGGIMEASGMLKTITGKLMKFVHNAGTLVGSTVATCLFFNITASDQYLSIVIPGRMYAKKFRDMGFKPELLSRTLEDSGTVTSVLVPWNTCGATQSSVLGVSTWAYAPYCFFNIISPFMSVFIASIGYKIRRYTPEEHARVLEEADAADRELYQEEEA
ncbi:MAG: Na+/H+ antiporter NhaC [Bacteroidales bacterium]|nr:Na+/H+ antiporter NhaC [Bacteroidales bacterium]MBP7037166.1 Na+/H+ antiporter NhaC [Bacteroidales bacterium]